MLGEIVYTSTRYVLGHRRVPQGWRPEGDYISLPVYAYVHGDILISDAPFSCPWDSAQCGIIWCHTKDIPGTLEEAYATLRDEIREFAKTYAH